MLPQWEVVGSWGMAGTEAERSLRDQGAVVDAELIPGGKISQGLEEKSQKAHYICQLNVYLPQSGSGVDHLRRKLAA